MKIEAQPTTSTTAEAAQAKAEARLLLEENGKLREALQWLLNDLEDYPASARPLAAYDNARAALGEDDFVAAIRALSDTPPDMVLVPREPTNAMIKACLEAALDFMAETKTTDVHPGQTYPSPGENARRCWRAMVKAARKGEGDE